MTATSTREVARRWHAGETGCGVLVIGLKREIAMIEAHELLEVVALDAGAPSDIPSWCRLTGHKLIEASHPRYVLQRKES